MNEVVFVNGPSHRPFVEILELFVEKEKKYKWVVTIGRDNLLAFSSQDNQYESVLEKWVLGWGANESTLTKDRIGYWNLKSQAKAALIAALRQDSNLFHCGFLFWEGNEFNIEQRSKFLKEEVSSSQDVLSAKMAAAEARVNQESAMALGQKPDGLYSFNSHGFKVEIKIEGGKLFGAEIKNGKIIWYPCFLCLQQLNALAKNE